MQIFAHASRKEERVADSSVFRNNDLDLNLTGPELSKA